MRNYYQDMDLAYNCTQDEIKGQYKRLARQFHPDKNPNNPHAEQRFKEINEAYTTLSDEHRRLQYDFELQNYNQQQSYRQQTHNQSSQKRSNDFFDSQLWSTIRGFAGNMAQDFVRNLDQEIKSETHGVDEFIERVAKINGKHNPNGSITVTCTISKDHLREITSLASRGMDVEQFSADVGTLFSAVLTEAIMDKWRY